MQGLGSVLLRTEGTWRRAQVRAHHLAVVLLPQQNVGQDVQAGKSFAEERPWLLGLASGSAHVQGLCFLEFQLRPVFSPYSSPRGPRGDSTASGPGRGQASVESSRWPLS